MIKLQEARTNASLEHVAYVPHRAFEGRRSVCGNGETERPAVLCDAQFSIGRLLARPEHGIFIHVGLLRAVLVDDGPLLVTRRLGPTLLPVDIGTAYKLDGNVLETFGLADVQLHAARHGGPGVERLIGTFLNQSNSQVRHGSLIPGTARDTFAHAHRVISIPQLHLICRKICEGFLWLFRRKIRPRLSGPPYWST